MGKIITGLRLDKFDARTGKRTFRHEQQSRSFLLGMIEALYIPVAQILSGTPLTTSRDLDRVLQSLCNYNGDGQATTHILRMAAGPGNMGCGMANNIDPVVNGIEFLSQDVGIMVGTDNTAVTPSDRRLVARVGHGINGIDGAPVLQNEYNVTDDTETAIGAATTRLAQPFVPTHDFDLTSVFIKIFKAGAPGNVTVRIRGSYYAGGGAKNPSGNFTTDLGSGTILEAAIPGASPGAQTECVMATPIPVYAGRMYWICVEAVGASAGNTVSWRRDDTLSTNYNCPMFANGQYSQSIVASSGDSGATYSTTYSNAPSFLFQVMGQSRGEFEIGACEVGGLTIADPNGSFWIRRRFSNNCGDAISIAEVGLGITVTANSMQHVILAARDVVGPAVNVLDGEILEVTYTPSIVV